MGGDDSKGQVNDKTNNATAPAKPWRLDLPEQQHAPNAWWKIPLFVNGKFCSRFWWLLQKSAITQPGLSHE